MYIALLIHNYNPYGHLTSNTGYRTMVNCNGKIHVGAIAHFLSFGADVVVFVVVVIIMGVAVVNVDWL